MNIAGTLRQTNTAAFKKGKTVLWILFIVYFIIAGIGISHHELWGDEIHSWNIAKGSTTFFDLVHNRRFEGHPPAWYAVLWAISKFSHNLMYMQIAQFVFIIAAVFILIFYAPLPLIIKVLIPFGYYFIFEFAVFSRNYAIGLFFCFLLCAIIRKDFKYKMLWYYILLFLMSNTHLLAAVLAGSIHLWFLLFNLEKKKKPSFLIIHAVLGVLVLLPALYFVAIPSEGQVNEFIERNPLSSERLAVMLQMPLRSFAPIPAWWENDFWNTQFLLNLHNKYHFLRFVYPVLSAVLVTGVFYILSGNKKASILFGVNLFLTAIVCLFYELIYIRYLGYIFISFIVSFWFYNEEEKFSVRKIKWIIGYLCVQIIAGLYALQKDIRLPFSKAYEVPELVKEVPLGKKVVTDYQALNLVSAFIDKPIYCIDLENTVSFIVWGPHLKKLRAHPYNYDRGVKDYFRDNKIDEVYMVAIVPPKGLQQNDSLLFVDYHVELTAAKTGAIEKGSNVYLYHITTK